MKSQTQENPNAFKYALVINFVVLIVIFLLSSIMTIASSDTYAIIGFAFIMLGYCIACFVVNIILSIIFFILKRKKAALGCLLSAFVVTIIGIGACFGGAYIIESL